MMTAAMRFYGGALFGFGELDQRMRDKVVTSCIRGNTGIQYIDQSTWTDTVNKLVTFEDVDQGYETTTKRVIPNKPMWWVCMDFPGSKHQYQHYPSALGSGRSAHDNIRVIFYPSMTNFMRYLGYQWLGTMADGSDAMPDNGPAILGGIAEDARQGILILTPEMALAHSMWSAITDLEVAPTNPIDAGMFRFCASCGKCADICPSSSINKDKEPSWDLPSIQGKPNIEHHPGRKAFWSDGAGCRLYINENSKCHMCIGSCSFMVGEGAMVHNVLKPTIASTGLLDGFFTKMSTTFGYGLKPPEEWWDENLPIMGFDSTCVSGAGYHQ
jgi:reductive dehalogenase